MIVYYTLLITSKYQDFDAVCETKSSVALVFLTDVIFSSHVKSDLMNAICGILGGGSSLPDIDKKGMTSHVVEDLC